jgi:hypothetical protein
MKKFSQKLTTLKDEIQKKLFLLIQKRDEVSKYQSTLVLKIKKDELQFNLGGNRYLIEISPTELIDNYGYTYSHDALTIEQWCEIIDSF